MALLFTFKKGWIVPSDEWVKDRPAISEEKTLNAVKQAFEAGRILVVEHWFYRGSRSPDRLVFDDFEMFEDYLKEKAFAGDSIHVFDITDALEDGKQLAYGKCPNEQGETPKRGAY
jgi:hypothetical protein